MAPADRGPSRSTGRGDRTPTDGRRRHRRCSEGRRTYGPCRYCTTRRAFASRATGFHLVRVDVVAGDGVGDLLRLGVAGSRQAVEDGDDEVGRVDLEVLTQRGARVAPAVAVCA